jgi:hypothetical protein
MITHLKTRTNFIRYELVAALLLLIIFGFVYNPLLVTARDAARPLRRHPSPML